VHSLENAQELVDEFEGRLRALHKGKGKVWVQYKARQASDGGRRYTRGPATEEAARPTPKTEMRLRVKDCPKLMVNQIRRTGEA
jgi:hypothetical protein